MHLSCLSCGEYEKKRSKLQSDRQKHFRNHHLQARPDSVFAQYCRQKVDDIFRTTRREDFQQESREDGGRESTRRFQRCLLQRQFPHVSPPKPEYLPEILPRNNLRFQSNKHLTWVPEGGLGSNQATWSARGKCPVAGSVGSKVPLRMYSAV